MKTFQLIAMFRGLEEPDSKTAGVLENWMRLDGD